MEKAYKVALEIIKRICVDDTSTYIDKRMILSICETALDESAEAKLNKAIQEATSIANRGSNNV